MPIDLQCGECSGVLSVEEPGGMVACPHCGAHLLVPAAHASELAMAGASTGSSSELAVSGLGTDIEGVGVSEPKTEELPDAVLPVPCDPPTEQIPEAARASLERVMNGTVDRHAATEAFQLPPPMTSPSPTSGEDLAATTPFALPANGAKTATTTQTSSSRSKSRSTSSTETDVPMVPKLWLHWALTACSILGILVLSLGYAVSQQVFRRHQLESLPDLAPPKARSSKQSVSHINVPFDAPMAPLHTMTLGETRRYGDLEVTPVKVVRAPVEFSHFDAAVKETRPATAPVFKLVLQVKNVGAEAFVPFDHDLIFGREPDPKKLELLRANNFVCGPEGRKDSGHRVLMYDQTAGAVWDLKDQLCGRELAPGESAETYLATEEHGLDELSGDLVWRVHFRKGHNPVSGRGVTTLIEVTFRADDVEA